MADASRSLCPRGVLLAQIVFPGRFCFKHHAVADKHSFLLAIMIIIVCVHTGKAAYLLAVRVSPEVSEYYTASIGVLLRGYCSTITEVSECFLEKIISND